MTIIIVQAVCAIITGMNFCIALKGSSRTSLAINGVYFGFCAGLLFSTILNLLG